MKGLKFIFAGIGFILLTIASAVLMLYGSISGVGSLPLYDFFVLFPPFIGIILIIVGLAKKEQ